MKGKINNTDQVCWAKKVTFAEGKERGMTAIFVSNSKISFTILCDKGMDIYNLSHRGTNISFITKNGLTNYGSDFNSAFCGGMLYTCGLDTVGGRTMPVHGRIHNTGAEIEEIKVSEQGVKITGTVRQCGLFQENLFMRRTIYTDYNSDKIKIDTEIINEGYTDAEYCILFHMNIGYPMLDKGTEIFAPVISTLPRTPWAEKNMEKCFVMEEPVQSEEQVFYHKVKTGEIKVKNKDIKKQVTFNYDNEMLPHFIEWKSMIKGDYALGIEPSTTTLDDDFKKKIISAGKKDTYSIQITVEDIG